MISSLAMGIKCNASMIDLDTYPYTLLLLLLPKYLLLLLHKMICSLSKINPVLQRIWFCKQYIAYKQIFPHTSPLLLLYAVISHSAVKSEKSAIEGSRALFASKSKMNVFDFFFQDKNFKKKLHFNF